MTDEQRIESIKKILHMLHHPAHRDVGDKNEILINRTKNYPGITEKSRDFERFFAIRGKDTYESGQQWSCGTVAKTFCYLNSILPKNEQLDVQIMISTHPDHLIDSTANHTLPCVKMSDGKWYAIEPQKNIIENRPRHPLFPDMPFIMDELKVGKKIHHIKENLADIPYEIRAIMSYPEYKEKCSDFGTFLKFGSKHDKRTKMMLQTIESVLQQINSNNHTGQIYDFCKLMLNSKLPIKIIEPKGCNYKTLVLKINQDLYCFSPGRNYVFLNKINCETEREWTIREYVKDFEARTIIQTHGRE